MNIERQRKFLIRFGFWAVVLLLIFLALKFALPILMPIAAAFIIAAMLNKPICYLACKMHYKRLFPALMITILFYLAAGILFSFLGIRVFTLAKDIFMQLPQTYVEVIEPALVSLFSSLETSLASMDPSAVTVLNEVSSSLLGSAGNFVTNLSMSAIGVVSGFAAAVPGIFLNLIITIIVTFFMTIDYPVITGFLVRQFPEASRKVLGEIKGFVRGTLLKCLASYILILSITFIELAVGFTIMGVHHGILIALGIAVFDILPVLGTGGIMVPWAVYQLATGNYGFGIGLLVLYLFITVIRNIIEPKIVGHQVGLHPVVTLGSMLVGLRLFGLIGLFGFPITLSLLKHLNSKGVIHLFK